MVADLILSPTSGDDAGEELPARRSGEDILTLPPGQVGALIGDPGLGLTRVGLALLADRALTGPVAYLDARGWLCPPAAWEVGIASERLVIVRCDDPVRWGRVTAALVAGVSTFYAEVPPGVKDAVVRRIAALARRHRASVLLRPLRGELPSGVAFLRLEGREVTWEGTDAGHGRLLRRRLVLAASGKAVRGIPRLIEIEDDGTNALRLVSGMGSTEIERATG